MGDVILFKEDVDQLNSLLKNLVDDAKILSALLITKDTRVLACQGTLSSTDTSALAALLVGSFASTQAIAGLIGETEFDTLSHCGKTRNVVISCIDNDTILTCIFDRSSTFDRIHTCVEKHLEVLKKAIRSIGSNTTHDLFDSGAASGAADAINEFEIRADALNKKVETNQPQSAEDTSVQHIHKVQKTEHELPPEPVPSQRTEHGHKAHQPQPQGTVAAPHGIKRPPDTEMIIIEQTKPKEEELVQREHPIPVGQTKDTKDEASAVQKPEQRTTPHDYEELLIETKTTPPARTSPSSPEAQPREGGLGISDTFHMSMNYLKNKTREGALYYHYDKAFFKKFFKSSHKKKT